MERVKITLVKSPIGYKKDQKATVRGLGLRKLNHSVEHDATPSIMGMAFKVKHLVKVEHIEQKSGGKK